MLEKVALNLMTGGLGYAFVTHFAALQDYTVLGLARNKEATNAKLQKDCIGNVTILEADITDSEALQKAADETSKITGGTLDLLINNAAFISTTSAFKTLLDLSPSELEEEMSASFRANVVGVAHTVNAFLPLIRKGNLKKIVTISTGMADDDLVNRFSVSIAGPYAISKAATNTLVAKYNATLGKEGILCMAISPGVVDTSEGGMALSEAEMKGVQAMFAQFADYAPHFKGPITPEQSVAMVTDVIDKATVETMGGQFVSHFGNKQWL